jgi:hypothetical protein
VRTGLEADVAGIEELHPDEIVVATGSNWERTGGSIVRGPESEIPGLDQIKVLTPLEAISDPRSAGSRVLVVEEHGGFAPLGLAALLGEQGATVHLVSRHLFIGEETVASLDLPWVMPRLAELGVALHHQSLVFEVTPSGTAVIGGIWGGDPTEIEIDGVVLVMGRKPANLLYSALAERGFGPQRIGDCLAPREVDRAMFEGERVGRLI